MTQELEIVEIAKVKAPLELYPRNKVDWYTVSDYRHKMEAGAEFPPIVVARIGNELILVDGMHRLEANKLSNQTHIQAKVLEGKSKKEVFVLAVEYNNAHGLKLSVQDRLMVAHRLSEFEFSLPQISEMVRIPVEKLTELQAKRMTNTVTGEVVFLKPATKHLAGQVVPENFTELQTKFNGRGQVASIKQVVNIIRDGLLDYKNKAVMKELWILKGLVNGIKFEGRKKK